MLRKGFLKPLSELRYSERDSSKKYVRETDEFEILTQLQHYGGKINLIDFTTDSFTPYSLPVTAFLERMAELSWSMNRQITQPRNPTNRVIAQKSILVRPPRGFVEPDDVVIDQGLKLPLLDYLRTRRPLYQPIPLRLQLLVLRTPLPLHSGRLPNRRLQPHPTLPLCPPHRKRGCSCLQGAGVHLSRPQERLYGSTSTRTQNLTRSTEAIELSIPRLSNCAYGPSKPCSPYHKGA